MDINKLYIFTKDTDAFSSQRGYNYQTLKTLETWVENFVSNIKEDIYCEYEEDVFQKNSVNKEIKFRQIKLYSSNFSFNSEEIKKCIAHFFMLHVKSDYNDFTKEFIFETNTNIANKYLDNDAELLKEWHENQNDLPEKNLLQYAEKVKSIVTEYVSQQKANGSNTQDFKEAVIFFEQLDDIYWKNFTQTIKWKFLGIAPEEEFKKVKERVDQLIIKLPYNIDFDETQQVFGVLLERVFSKANEENPENRRLTWDELEDIILNIGTEEDKWYASHFNYYKEISPLYEFRMGEFYEIIDLANYCRRKKYLLKHKDIWNPFLIYYARSTNIHELFRRKAIYELVFLNNEFYEVDYNKLAERERPNGNLFGFESDLRFYFGDLTAFKSAEDLENASIICKLLFVIIENEKVNISLDELRKWYVGIYRKINQRLLHENDVNEKCKLLEQKGTYLLGINRLRSRSNIEFLMYFDEVLKLAEEAPLFKLSQFGDRIEKYIKIQISSDPKDELGIIAALEEFSEKLFPLVEKREGKSQLAKQQVQRGFSYLQTSEPFNLLKALQYFHKAKDNYQQEDTIEGFILALLNIAQLYNAIGMHFAAKYYALASFRMSMNHELIKRTETSLSLLFHSDFKQGSWFNAMDVYGKYMAMRLDSNFNPAYSEEEVMNTRSVSLILFVMGADSTQFKYLIDNYIGYIDHLGTKTGECIGEKIIKPSIDLIASELDTAEAFNSVIENHIDDFPLNDIGPKRTIRFYALGSKWIISFNNEYQMLSIAEEYIASIQIILAEIALSNIDFQLLKSKIEIDLVLSKHIAQPEQIPSNEIIKWKINVVHFDETNVNKINMHSAYNMTSLLYILMNISLLETNEFKKLFTGFFKKFQVDTKQQSVNLYQKIHRDVYTSESFKALYSSKFEKRIFDIKMPVENKVMKWKDSLSSKYDKAFCVEAIKNRFNNTYPCIYITLDELKKNPEFYNLIKEIRSKGWKDWQIIITMQNFIINYKINLFEKKNFQTDKEYVQHFQKMYSKYLNLDEKDCYVEFPIQAFKSKEFFDQFNISILSTLHTYGLECKLTTPNFKAIKEYLDIRFNFANDNYEENNPLKDII